MGIRDKIINTLQGLNYEIRLQGSYRVDNMPDSLITYWIPSATDLRSYNNRPQKSGYAISIGFYSRQIDLIDTVSELISDLMLEAGFTREGPGQDAGFDKDTGHYGWLMDFYFVERKEM